MYKDLKILLLGGARSGISAAKLICEGNDVTLCDMKELNEEDRKELESLGVKIIISDHQEDIIDDSYFLIDTKTLEGLEDSQHHFDKNILNRNYHHIK